MRWTTARNSLKGFLIKKQKLQNQQQLQKYRGCFRSLHYGHENVGAALSSVVAFGDSSSSSHSVAWWLAASTAVATVAGGNLAFQETTTTRCDEKEYNDNRSSRMLGTSLAGKSVLEDVVQVRKVQRKAPKKLPVFTSKQVAENNGKNGKPIWMSYGGNVYDVTDFVNNHPGGSEKILLAAGSYIEPFWHLYRQHFASDLPSRLLDSMLIGELDPVDQEKIDEQMEANYNDPYSMEPTTERNKALIVHSEQPMNAEVPEHLLTKSYLTPPDLFYIRHHHPVPFLEDVQSFELEIDLGGDKTKKISLQDLKKMPKVEVTATLQCSGNRRGGYNDFARTSGTSWGQGAISNATWGGVRLSDLIKHSDIDKDVQHVRFHAMDGMMASIGIEKAMNPYGDVILCYEMNGKPLPRDHGYPLRVIVPGYAAVRNVKWVKKIELAQDEAEGPWQRGLNYKVLPPGITDANQVDLKQIPSMTELSVQSGITSVEPVASPRSKLKPGQTVMVKAKGWAYSGGGRNIVRVDVTGDGANSWKSANLLSGKEQKFGRAWAWTFWECIVPATVQEDGQVQIYSKAVDMAFNSQPDSASHNWNVRGLTNNSWYGKRVPMAAH